MAHCNVCHLESVGNMNYKQKINMISLNLDGIYREWVHCK